MGDSRISLSVYSSYSSYSSSSCFSSPLSYFAANGDVAVKRIDSFSVVFAADSSIGELYNRIVSRLSLLPSWSSSLSTAATMSTKTTKRGDVGDVRGDNDNKKYDDEEGERRSNGTLPSTNTTSLAAVAALSSSSSSSSSTLPPSPPSLLLCAIYDKSFSPPTDVTEIFASYPNLSGPKCRTVQSMGWFPSARLAIVYPSSDLNARLFVRDGIEGSIVLDAVAVGEDCDGVDCVGDAAAAAAASDVDNDDNDNDNEARELRRDNRLMAHGRASNARRRGGGTARVRLKGMEDDDDKNERKEQDKRNGTTVVHIGEREKGAILPLPLPPPPPPPKPSEVVEFALRRSRLVGPQKDNEHNDETVAKCRTTNDDPQGKKGYNDHEAKERRRRDRLDAMLRSLDEMIEFKQKEKEEQDKIQKGTTDTTAVNDKELKKRKSRGKRQGGRGVSEQVRKMLIKSRAEGDTNLKEMDKFYLATTVLDDSNANSVSDDDDDDNGEENNVILSSSSYRFFSRVSNAGKVASALASSYSSYSSSLTQRDVTVELLVAVQARGDETMKDSNGHDENNDNDNGGGIDNSGSSTGVVTSKNNRWSYRKLPNLMALHDAERLGLLNQFDQVVARICLVGDETPTAAIATSTATMTAASVVGGAIGDMTDDDDPLHTAVVGAEEERENTKKEGEEEEEEKEKAVASNGGGGDSDDDHDNDKDEVRRRRFELCKRIYNAVEEASESAARGGKRGRGGKEEKKTSAAAPKARSRNKTKKKGKAADKVRQILIKSKAKGDAKRVAKEEDRLYLEVVAVTVSAALVGDCGGWAKGCVALVGGEAATKTKTTKEALVIKAESSYRFFHRNWNVSTIVGSVPGEDLGAAGAVVEGGIGSGWSGREPGALTTMDPNAAEVLTERNVGEGEDEDADEEGAHAPAYDRLPPELRLRDAESSGCLRQFDRVIVVRQRRICENSSWWSFWEEEAVQ